MPHTNLTVCNLNANDYTYNVLSETYPNKIFNFIPDENASQSMLCVIIAIISGLSSVSIDLNTIHLLPPPKILLAFTCHIKNKLFIFH
jgi:hypothetical protein